MIDNKPVPLRCVLFDLDGTLLDTAPDLGAAVNHVLVSEGFAPLSDAIIRQTTSTARSGCSKPGLAMSCSKSWGPLACAPPCSTTTRRTSVSALDPRPYEGMVNLIEWLDEKKLPWGIVTNKPGFLTEPLLAALPELASCGVTVSADTLPVRKPDPAPMYFACEQLGIDAAHCLYVGDHVRDIEAGRNAGMRTAVAGWGYLSDDEDPADWGADLHFDTVQALHHWLRYELA
ncbi:HAD family hydrolase [Aeromonas salmonicida]|uniref:HAD family hydrolase n=1 Tax=Aeromonas salmonicida TaxID=645 RepID=UPI00366DE487